MNQIHRITAMALLATSVNAMAYAQKTATPTAPVTSAVPVNASTLGNDLLEPLAPQAPPEAKPTYGNDMLEPLTQQAPPQAQQTYGNDMLEPLAQQAPSQELPTYGNDMLEPLIADTPATKDKASKPPKSSDADKLYDMIEALEERRPSKTVKPRPIPRDTDYQEYLRAEKRQKEEPRKTVLVRKIRIDPCGDYEFNMRGEKINCRAREIAYHELQYVDEPASTKNSQVAGTGPRSSGARPSAAPAPIAGGSPASAPAGGAAAAGPGATPGPAATNTGGGVGGGTGAGQPAGSVVSAPADAAGFRQVGQFATRVESVRIDGDHLDVRVTFRANPGATRIVGNGDWFANAADADGVGMESTALWRPTDGKPQPFDLTPRVPSGQTAQVRFMIPLEAGHAGIARISIRDLSGDVASFDMAGHSDLAATAPAVVRSNAAPARIGDFAVVADHVASWVDGRAELIFSARNVSTQRRFLGGTRLVFRARQENGDMIEATGRVYLARGKAGRAVEMAAVEAGATAQMRVFFETPAILGPLNVSDGSGWASVAMPPVAEPAW